MADGIVKFIKIKCRFIAWIKLRDNSVNVPVSLYRCCRFGGQLKRFFFPVHGCPLCRIQSKREKQRNEKLAWQLSVCIYSLDYCFSSHSRGLSGKPIGRDREGVVSRRDPDTLTIRSGWGKRAKAPELMTLTRDPAPRSPPSLPAANYYDSDYRLSPEELVRPP